MAATETEYLEEEKERERSEEERKELLKKQAEELALALAIKKGTFQGAYVQPSVRERGSQSGEKVGAYENEVSALPEGTAKTRGRKGKERSLAEE